MTQPLGEMFTDRDRALVWPPPGSGTFAYAGNEIVTCVVLSEETIPAALIALGTREVDGIEMQREVIARSDEGAKIQEITLAWSDAAGRRCRARYGDVLLLMDGSTDYCVMPEALFRALFKVGG